MPPIYGLYSSLIPLIIYAFFGTSRHLSIGPVAITSILISTGVSQMATPFSDYFVELVLLLGLLIGLVQVIFGLLKIGFLVNAISQPVISGLISAAAFIIIVSQLKSGFGIDIPSFGSVFESLKYFFFHIDESNFLTVIITVISVLILLIFKKLPTNFPIAIVLIALFTSCSYFFDFQSYEIAIVGNIPEGLPKLYLPNFKWETIKLLLPTVFTITIIGYVGSIGIAKSFQMKYRDYEVNTNKEFIALGLAKIAGTFFQGNLVSGSYSRSAINAEAGAKTNVSAIFTAFLILMGLLFLTPLLYYLPKSVLESIILVSVLSLIKIKEAISYAKIKIDDFAIMITTLLVSLIINIETGILTGVLLSFVILQYRSATPHVAELVKIEGTNYFRNINRFSKGIQDSRYIIIRFDDQLYFGNATYFKDSIYSILNKRKKVPEFVILHATNIHSIDSTGLYYLESLNKELDELGIQLVFSATIGPVRDILARSDNLGAMNDKKQFMSIQDAITYTETSDLEKKDASSLSLQHNTSKNFWSRIIKK